MSRPVDNLSVRVSRSLDNRVSRSVDTLPAGGCKAVVDNLSALSTMRATSAGVFLRVKSSLVLVAARRQSSSNSGDGVEDDGLVTLAPVFGIAFAELDEETMLNDGAEIAGQRLARDAEAFRRPPLPEVEGPESAVAVVAVGQAGPEQEDRLQAGGQNGEDVGLEQVEDDVLVAVVLMLVVVWRADVVAVNVGC